MKEPKITPAQLEQYREDGYVIINKLLPPEISGRLLERADGMLEGRYPSKGFKCGAASAETPDDPGRLIKQIAPLKTNYDPIPDPVFESYKNNPVLKAVARTLMECEDAQVFQQQVLCKDPGSANATPWHQDEWYWRLAKLGHEAVTAWMPLLPTDAENGTMWLLPGSHRGRLLQHASAGGASKFQGIIETVPEEKMVPLELEPGDVSFHHRDMVHGAFSNSGKKRRVAIAQHYKSMPPGQASTE